MAKPYHIPAWEKPMLQEIVDGHYPAARAGALQAYVAERERRRRHATVRDQRDRRRRTLVGAHMNRADADIIAKLADAEGLSVTAFVKQALEHEARRSIYFQR